MYIVCVRNLNTWASVKLRLLETYIPQAFISLANISAISVREIHVNLLYVLLIIYIYNIQ